MARPPPQPNRVRESPSRVSAISVSTAGDTTAVAKKSPPARF